MSTFLKRCLLVVAAYEAAHKAIVVLPRARIVLDGGGGADRDLLVSERFLVFLASVGFSPLLAPAHFWDDIGRAEIGWRKLDMALYRGTGPSNMTGCCTFELCLK